MEEWPKRCIEEMPARIEVRRAEKRRQPARIGAKPIARLFLKTGNIAGVRHVCICVPIKLS
jgi:hypothetical protein